MTHERIAQIRARLENDWALSYVECYELLDFVAQLQAERDALLFTDADCERWIRAETKLSVAEEEIRSLRQQLAEKTP